MDTNGSNDHSTPGTARRVWKPALRVMYAALTALCLTAIVQAADGDRDPTFGVGGEVMTDFAGSADHAYAMVIDGNGGIVVAGFTVRLFAPRHRTSTSASPATRPTEPWTAHSDQAVRCRPTSLKAADSPGPLRSIGSGRIVVAGSTLTTAGT